MKKLISFAIILTLSVMFTSCCGNKCMMKKKGIDMKTGLEALLQTDRDFSLYAVEHGSAAAFKKYFADDAIQLPQGGQPVYGSGEIYEGMLGFAEKYDMEWEPQEGQIAASGDLGWTWGRYTYYKKGEKSPAGYGKYVSVWNKDADGEWKVKVDIGNGNPGVE